MGDFFNCPSWGNAGWALLDGVSLLPLIPSIGYITHADDAAKLVGKADDVIKAGETEFKLIDHAIDAMKNRSVTVERVSEAISKGATSVGNVAGRTVYDIGSTISNSGRGLRVVVEDATNEIITIIDKGSDYLR